MTKTGQLQRIAAINRLGTSGALALGAIFVTAAIGTPPAQAQTYKVLHKFKGAQDGGNPYAGVIRDSAGNLYGTVSTGGDDFSPSGHGAVFKLNKAGKVKALYELPGGANAAVPYGGVIRDSAGNLYGTGYAGGSGSQVGCNSPLLESCGAVFSLDSTFTETALYSFHGPKQDDAAGPYAGLIRSKAGNLYGTTLYGPVLPDSNGCGIVVSELGCGTVFEIDPSVGEKVLYNFSGGSDGGLPYAGLIRDSKGRLYGTTASGGGGVDVGACNAGCGVVFKVSAVGAETVLYAFTGGADGAIPYASLIRDSEGNLYGTTSGGGSASGSLGCGVVFKLDNTGKETVLYSFKGYPDGCNPYAGLVQDSAGNFYGTTAGGGAADYGTVFELDTSGNETVLYSFTGGADGANPHAGLVRDSAGNLYGTTLYGGIATGPSGLGVVFELTP
jgi:uncharacterized repeat protein (TIGR03803 family)